MKEIRHDRERRREDNGITMFLNNKRKNMN